MRWHILILLLAALWPEAAFAHSSVPGIQGIYWGMLHPLTSGPQVLALFALGLLIQQGLPKTEDVFHGFWAFCLVGAGVAAFGLLQFDPQVALTALAIVAGILVASAIKLPLAILVSLGAIGGGLSGYISWPDPGAKGDMMISALGAIVGSVLLIMFVAGIIEMTRQGTKWSWIPIAVRVLGSWIAAVSLLLGALIFRKMA